MEVIQEYLPFIIPLFVAEVSLAIFSAIHVWKHDNYRFGNRMIWMFVVIFILLIGPFLYFTVGRGED